MLDPVTREDAPTFLHPAKKRGRKDVDDTLVDVARRKTAEQREADAIVWSFRFETVARQTEAARTPCQCCVTGEASVLVQNHGCDLSWCAQCWARWMVERGESGAPLECPMCRGVFSDTDVKRLVEPHASSPSVPINHRRARRLCL